VNNLGFGTRPKPGVWYFLVCDKPDTNQIWKKQAKKLKNLKGKFFLTQNNEKQIQCTNNSTGRANHHLIAHATCPARTQVDPGSRGSASVMAGQSWCVCCMWS
jgi:hypothetical protein